MQFISTLSLASQISLGILPAIDGQFLVCVGQPDDHNGKPQVRESQTQPKLVDHLPKRDHHWPWNHLVDQHPLQRALFILEIGDLS